MRIPAAFGRLLGIHNAISGVAFFIPGIRSEKRKTIMGTHSTP